MRNQLSVLLFWLLTVLYPGGAFAEEPPLRFDASASSAWIPYYTGNREQPGIIHESIIAIFEQAGLTAKQVTLPPKRTLLALAQGELDFHVMSLDWFPNGDYDSKNFVMSDTFVTVDEYLVALEKTPELDANFDIRGRRIGTVSGYFYHNQTQFERVDFPSEEALLKALRLKRVKYAIIGDLPALYWANKLGIPISLLKQHSSGELRLRIRKEKAYLLNRINQAIRTLKSQNAFKKIEVQYRQAYNFPAAQ